MPSEPSHESFLVRPFAALRPASAHAAAVAAPPYDVLSTAEARARAAGNSESFLHVSRAEIDLGGETSPYSDIVYATAARNLAAFREREILVRDPNPAYYCYRISNGERSQTGIALAASVRAYNENRILRHELTRPAKETDRVRQIEAVNAITGPVLLVHRHSSTLKAQLTHATNSGAALLDASVDGWRHEIWRIDDATTVAEISAIMNAMGKLYIADGHHRSAAAARVAATRERERGARVCASAEATFLAVSFAEDEVTILDYNRVIRDLNGLTPTTFLQKLERDFDMQKSDVAVRPAAPLTYGLYLAGQWYHLAAKESARSGDVVERLDVSVLDALVLAPLLGVEDPRTDERIDFIGGSRGPDAIAERIDGGAMQVGFTLYPTQMRDLMQVADSGRIMPPKSTWFEPKLADGLLSIVLE